MWFQEMRRHSPGVASQRSQHRPRKRWPHERECRGECESLHSEFGIVTHLVLHVLPCMLQGFVIYRPGLCCSPRRAASPACRIPSKPSTLLEQSRSTARCVCGSRAPPALLRQPAGRFGGRPWWAELASSPTWRDVVVSVGQREQGRGLLGCRAAEVGEEGVPQERWVAQVREPRIGRHEVQWGWRNACGALPQGAVGRRAEPIRGCTTGYGGIVQQEPCMCRMHVLQQRLATSGQEARPAIVMESEVCIWVLLTACAATDLHGYAACDVLCPLYG